MAMSSRVQLALLMLAALLLAAAAAQAQPSAPTPAAGRSEQRLDGAWRYIVDPMKMGLRPGRMRNFSRDLTAQNQELLEYEWASAPVMTIPGDWSSQVGALGWYEGMMWFHRRFTAAPQPGQRQLLQFDAVNYHAHVYLNGEKLGEHRGGFTPFAVDVTGKVRAGANVLVVGADNRHLSTSVPAQQVDWWNYGGITRPVRLLSLPATFVRSHSIGLGRDGQVAATVQLDGAGAAGAAVTLALPELGWSRRMITDGEGRATLIAAPPRGLARWSPQSPRLYDALITTGFGETLTDRVGFRTIAVAGKQIMLNGKPIFLRGISLHEEALGSTANRTITPAAARALLGEAKALGANFVRLAHYPHSEEMTRAADAMGLMVWSEIPVYWDMAFANHDTLAEAKAMMAEMMQRDAARASVIIWSVGNETPETPERLSFMRALIDDVRARDGHRLVSAALHDNADDSSGPEGKVRVDDPLGAFVDVLAMNRYEAWYGYRTPPQIDEVGWIVAYDKPLIFSEFGADALYGHHADPLTRWSEEYQALLYERTFAMADRIPGLAGTVPWILKDFRSPRRFHTRFQNYWNRKGLIDPAGNRKLAWQVVHDRYTKQAAAE
jgi:beta-glucuronidase